MDTVYPAAATRHATSIGRRITLAAICTVGITAALGPAVEHIGSAAAAADTIQSLAAPASAPGVIAVSWCPSPPAKPATPGHLPQVVHASNTCHQSTTTGDVSPPDTAIHNPGDGRIDTGDGSVCVGYEIQCHQPFYRSSM